MTSREMVPDYPGEDDPGDGRRLAFDVGRARIGIATCDAEGILATPVETVRLRNHATQASVMAHIRDVIVEYEPVELIVGLPITLRNYAGSSVDMVADFITDLDTLKMDLPVRLVDERLSTVVATTALREAQVDGCSQRGVIDQAAAVEILKTWLDMRKNYFKQVEKGESDGTARES